MKKTKEIFNTNSNINEPDKPYIFNSSLEQVLEYIKVLQHIEGINLLDAIKNSSFTFITNDAPNFISLVSDVLAIAIKYGKEINPEIQELGRQKVKNNADDFAKEMYPVIQNLKSEHGIDTFRETIDSLNMKKINTARGRKWHLRNYELLTKRWKKLGYNT